MKRFDGYLDLKFLQNLAKKWIRNQLKNQSKWDILLGFMGTSSSFDIQDEAEKEKYIHILN